MYINGLAKTPAYLWGWRLGFYSGLVIFASLLFLILNHSHKIPWRFSYGWFLLGATIISGIYLSRKKLSSEGKKSNVTQ